MAVVSADAPQPLDKLSGLIERVTYFNEETGFAVLRVKASGHRDLVTVIGSLPSASAGEWLTAEGMWVRNKEHGLQLKAIDILSVIEHRSGELEMVDGIGPKRRLRSCSTSSTNYGGGPRWQGNRFSWLPINPYVIRSRSEFSISANHAWIAQSSFPIVEVIGPVCDLIGTTVTPRSASSYTVAITSRMSLPRRDTFHTSKRSNFRSSSSARTVGASLLRSCRIVPVRRIRSALRVQPQPRAEHGRRAGDRHWAWQPAPRKLSWRAPDGCGPSLVRSHPSQLPEADPRIGSQWSAVQRKPGSRERPRVTSHQERRAAHRICAAGC